MAHKRLHLADNFSLPIDLVTESIAILAIKGAGKSTLSRRIVEQIFYAGQQCVVVDPKGDWWGLRYGKDGKSPGLPFVIIGGEHGDIPLPSGIGPGAIEKNGETIARLAAIDRISLVVDLSSYRKHELARFTTHFLENLYRLKGKDEYRTPMMLAIDEADAIAPQRPVKSEGGIEPRMLGAAEDIVRRGRQRGIGSMLVTQRPAVLNKNVSTQCPILFALRTSGTQDIDAIKDWIDANYAQAPVDVRRQITDVLSQLLNGEGWMLSSSFPMPPGTRHRTRFHMPDTFDSSATPTAGKTHIVPKNAADVDLEAVKAQMSTEIERAKKEDPKILQKRIHELESQLRTGANLQPGMSLVKTAEIEELRKSAKTQKSVEVPVVTEAHLKRIESAIEKLDAIREKLNVEAHELKAAIGKTQNVRPPAREVVHRPFVARPEPLSPKPPKRLPTIREMSGSIDFDLTKMQRSMLIALAQHPEGLTKAQVLLHTGYASSGSTSEAFAQLNRNGWTDTLANFVTITSAGLKVLGDYEPLPHGEELQRFLLSGAKLSRMEKAILQEICSVYPEAIGKSHVLDRANYKSSGSTSEAFARLVRYGYAVPAGSNQLRAAEQLFGE